MANSPSVSRKMFLEAPTLQMEQMRGVGKALSGQGPNIANDMAGQSSTRRSELQSRRAIPNPIKFGGVDAPANEVQNTRTFSKGRMLQQETASFAEADKKVLPNSPNLASKDSSGTKLIGRKPPIEPQRNSREARTNQRKAQSDLRKEIHDSLIYLKEKPQDISRKDKESQRAKPKNPWVPASARGKKEPTPRQAEQAPTPPVPPPVRPVSPRPESNLKKLRPVLRNSRSNVAANGSGDSILSLAHSDPVKSNYVEDRHQFGCIHTCLLGIRRMLRGGTPKPATSIKK